MSDPERRLFEQEALARYSPDSGSFAPRRKIERTAFVEGAMYAAHLVRKQRLHADRDEELRDQFAMAALAMTADPSMRRPAPEIAEAVYRVADAMIAVRAKAQAGGMEA